jgi:hypothetical protein
MIRINTPARVNITVYPSFVDARLAQCSGHAEHEHSLCPHQHHRRATAVGHERLVRAPSQTTCGAVAADGNVAKPLDKVGPMIFPGLTSASAMTRELDCPENVSNSY